MACVNQPKGKRSDRCIPMEHLQQVVFEKRGIENVHVVSRDCCSQRYYHNWLPVYRGGENQTVMWGITDIAREEGLRWVAFAEMPLQIQI